MTGVKRATIGLGSYAGTKPWIVAEAGSSDQPGSRPSWLTTGYKAVYRQVPNVAVIIYFDIDMQPISGQPDWLLTSSSDINAYKSLLQRTRFQGTIN